MPQLSNFDEIYQFLHKRFENEKEYLQAVHEVLQDIVPIYNANEAYKSFDVIRRLCMPERIIYFTISWMNSDGDIEVNQGWRVQHNSAMGPYKGGLRFHPTVNLSVLKFLAFEQCFVELAQAIGMRDFLNEDKIGLVADDGFREIFVGAGPIDGGYPDYLASFEALGTTGIK